MPALSRAAVLQGVEPEVDEFGGVLVAEHAADAAFVAGSGGKVGVGRVRVHVHCLAVVPGRQKTKGTGNASLCLTLCRSRRTEEGYVEPDQRFFFKEISAILPRMSASCRPLFTLEERL